MLPLHSSDALARHLEQASGWLQEECNRLHALYPQRCPIARIDAQTAISLVSNLFKNDHRYVGAYVHGVDCPTLNRETVSDAFALFEQMCLQRSNRVCLHGGVSAGKSSVLNLFGFLLPTLSALCDLPYLPLYFTHHGRYALGMAADFHTAYHEIYGSIAISFADQSLILASSPLWLAKRFGKAIGRPVVTLATAAAHRDELIEAGFQPIALCDDMHLLPRFDDIKEDAISVEQVERVFDKMVVVSPNPHYFAEYTTQQVSRTTDYAATHQWYRGEKLADAAVKLVPAVDFQQASGVKLRDLTHPFDVRSQTLAVRGIIDYCEKQAVAGAYLRLSSEANVEQVRGLLPANITSIVCDRRTERTVISDACWDAHLRGQQYVILSSGRRAGFHRSLPRSTGLFIDWTKEADLSDMRRGICGAACGYGRSASQVVLSDANVDRIAIGNTAHRRYARTGVLRQPVSRRTGNSIDYFADRVAHHATGLSGPDISDVFTMIRQHGKYAADTRVMREFR